MESGIHVPDKVGIQYVRVVLVSTVPYVAGVTSAVVVVCVEGSRLSTTVQAGRKMRAARPRRLMMMVFMMIRLLVFQRLKLSRSR